MIKVFRSLVRPVYFRSGSAHDHGHGLDPAVIRKNEQLKQQYIEKYESFQILKPSTPVKTFSLENLFAKYSLYPHYS